MPVPEQTAPLPRQSARMLVFERLREWIEDGTFRPGEVIKDVDIAAKFGVSRMPVREALQMLEQLGAVDTEPGRRTRVALARPSDASLIYPPLGALQAVAAEAVAGRATAEKLDEMRRANEALLEAVARDDAVAAREADDDFHGVLIGLAENPYLQTAIELLQLHSRRLDTAYFTHRGPSRESYDEHEQIIDAVSRGESEKAGELTRQNFVRTVDVVG
jgi:DNA-binding GntR family transcriptional regulator